MSLLRWPHNHHRDLRARLPAEASAKHNSTRDQDRYIMMPSRRSMTAMTLAFLAGAQPAAPHLASAPSIHQQRRRQSGRATCGPRFPSTRVSVSRAKASASTAAVQHQQARIQGQIPIAPAAPPLPHWPRFRALALFGRRHSGVRKPAQKATSDLAIGVRASNDFAKMPMPRRGVSVSVTAASRSK
jgi:hypothetical protein